MPCNPILPFHPVLATWFERSFGQPTDVQKLAWAQIMAGQHTLIASPTGSGKTLAALLPCLDRIVNEKQRMGIRKQGVKVLYITPLKALNNDIQHHLLQFTAEMERLGVELDPQWPGISVGVRTGDTLQSTRASMLRKPPDLLITTPESLYILMTSPRAREILKSVEQVIVDEIHDLAADKRGTHLSLTLERLAEWCSRSPQRIGVSATQKPLERVARFLGGWEEEAAYLNPPNRLEGEQTSSEAGLSEEVQGLRPRIVKIVESTMPKKFEISVTMPEQRIRSKDKESFWNPIVERIVQGMEGCSTVIIFVNSRRLCERLTLRLNDHVGYEVARTHHGSVSREKRLEVERMLKAGELKCLVATSSLELGIDVGHVDLVLQIDSPKSAAAGIQRVGRAGHAVGGASRGILLARSRSELPELAVLARAIAARDIEEIRIPRNSLDVLAQQVVAMIATDDWELGRLHRVLARSDSFRGLPRARLVAMLQVLAGFYPFARPLIEWDRDTGRLYRRANTPMAAIIGAGTIPQSSGYPVHHLDSRLHLGELDEEFVHESRVGDVFQLGTGSWRICVIKYDRIYVKESANNYSVIPFWKAEGMGRSFELGRQVGDFLEQLSGRLKAEESHSLTTTAKSNATQQWLEEQYFLDAAAAESLITLIQSQMAASEVPTARRIVIEHFADDANQYHVIIHSVFGKKVNRTWQFALRAQLEKTLPYPFYANAKDHGVELIFPQGDASWLQVIQQVTSSSLETLLLEAIPGTPQLGIAFRRLAETSLLLSRSFTRMPAWKKRLRSEELLKEALPFAEDFPFLHEAIKECMEESLDAANLKWVLLALEQGEIELVVRKSRFPSPLATQFLFDFANSAIYESDALGKDVQLRLLSVSKHLAAQWFGQDSLQQSIHPEVIAAEKQRLEGGAGRDVSEPEQLYRLLKERGDLTAAELKRLAGPAAEALLNELSAHKRVELRTIAGEARWICRDERDSYALFPQDQRSAAFILHRYIEHTLAFSKRELQHRFALPSEQLRELIAGWVSEKRIEPAPFAQAAPTNSALSNRVPNDSVPPNTAEEALWTSAKVASRIVRLSLQQLRKQEEPIAAAKFCSQLATLHHIHPEHRLSGEDGLRKVMMQLQGLFVPLSHWETIVFPARLTDYRKESLDLLCASGEVLWIGKKADTEREGRIAFFLTESKPLYTPYLVSEPSLPTKHPELLQLLAEKGACFLTVLSRETGLIPSVVLGQLLDLVWEGRVANDQFAPLRMQAQTPNKKPGKFQSGFGRWYLLKDLREEPFDVDKSLVGWVHHLLGQDGVITKDSVARTAPFAWDRIYGVLKQLEDWGMLARGMFIQNLPALQYSTPQGIEGLRQPWKSNQQGITLLSAVDPANPFGSLVDWPEQIGAVFSRKPGNYLILKDDRWLLWLENYGKKIIEIQTTAEQVMQSAEERIPDEQWKSLFKTLLQQSKQRKIVVEQWNTEHIADSPYSHLLLRIGAERERKSLVLWPSNLQ